MKGIKLNLILHFLLFLVCIGSFTNCKDRSDILYSEFIQFGNTGMIPFQDYVFETNLDSLYQKVSSDASVMLRYSDLCDLKTLSLKIESSALNSDSIFQKDISIPLFDETGFNKKRDGYGLYEIEIPILNDIDKSEGSFISLLTPDYNTKGIIAIGLIIKKQQSCN